MLGCGGELGGGRGGCNLASSGGAGEGLGLLVGC